MFKLRAKKIITILRSKILLNWTYIMSRDIRFPTLWWVSVKLLTEHYLESAQAGLSLHLSKTTLLEITCGGSHRNNYTIHKS